MEKKLKTIFITLIGIWIILMVVGILSGEINPNWSFFIAILSVVLLFFVSQSYWRKVKYGRIIQLINDRNHNLILQEIDNFKPLAKGKTLTAQMIQLNVAVLCLDFKDYENYLKHISLAQDERISVLKDFWNIIYLCNKQQLHDIDKIITDYLNIQEVDVVFLHQYKIQKQIVQIILQFYTDKTTIDSQILNDLIKESKTLSVKTLLEKIQENL